MINSSHEQEDLRVRRTHKFLWEAFLSLLEERSYGEISVTDICERAMVHRATFYKHYEDKYDLLMQGMRRMINQMEKDLRKHEEEKGKIDPKKRFVALFEHFSRHKQFYQFFLYEENVAYIQRLLQNELELFAEDRIKSRFQGSGESLSIPPTIVAQFDTGAVLSVLMWWLKNDMPASAEQMATYLYNLLYLGNNFCTKEEI